MKCRPCKKQMDASGSTHSCPECGSSVRLRDAGLPIDTFDAVAEPVVMRELPPVVTATTATKRVRSSTCAWVECGKTFTPTAKRQDYCDLDCRYAAQRERARKQYAARRAAA